jgi:hypothetical protein
MLEMHVFVRKEDMSQQANITAFDGASTPATHTLTGEDVGRGPDGTITAKWKESLTTVPDYAQIRFTQTKRKLKSGVFRVSNRTEVPVMEAINAQNSSGYTAPPKVAFVDTCETVGYFHERSTVASRRLCRQLHINILGSISTTVTPVVTGPVPELIDQLITVS